MYKKNLKKQISSILTAAVAVSAFSVPLSYATSVFGEETDLPATVITGQSTINPNDYTLPTDTNNNNNDNADANNDNGDKYTLPTLTPDDSDDISNSTMNKNNESDIASDDLNSDSITFDIPAGAKTLNSLNLNFKMMPRMRVIDSFAKVALYTKDGKYLGEATEWVGGITENITFNFNLPEYAAGETFVLKLKDGLSYIRYYENAYAKDEEILLTTYYYKDENGNDVYGNNFSFDACPMFEHAIVLYIDGKIQNPVPRPRLVNSTAMVPLRAVAEGLGFDVKYDAEYQSVVCSIGDEKAFFNIGKSYVTAFGNDTIMPADCTYIDGSIFVPARSFAEIMGCDINALDFGDHIDVCLGKSAKVTEYMNNIPVNRWGIDSKTNYLVWIDKSDFRVRVYTGSKYDWKLAGSFPCAIGAPSTPTVTGSFEYFRSDRWNYDSYYVGPCIVFYRGYALHSTLLRYDNTPYDDRVEVMISHGCVRLHKSDIDWIYSVLPMGSRIYVTE